MIKSACSGPSIYSLSTYREEYLHKPLGIQVWIAWLVQNIVYQSNVLHLYMRTPCSSLCMNIGSAEKVGVEIITYYAFTDIHSGQNNLIVLWNWLFPGWSFLFCWGRSVLAAFWLGVWSLRSNLWLGVQPVLEGITLPHSDQFEEGDGWGKSASRSHCPS